MTVASTEIVIGRTARLFSIALKAARLDGVTARLEIRLAGDDPVWLTLAGAAVTAAHGDHTPADLLWAPAENDPSITYAAYDRSGGPLFRRSYDLPAAGDAATSRTQGSSAAVEPG